MKRNKVKKIISTIAIYLIISLIIPNFSILANSKDELPALQFFSDGTDISNAMDNITVTEDSIFVVGLNKEYTYFLTDKEGGYYNGQQPNDKGELLLVLNLSPGTEYYLQAKVPESSDEVTSEEMSLWLSGSDDTITRNSSEKVLIRTLDGIVMDVRDQRVYDVTKEQGNINVTYSVDATASTGADCTVNWYQNSRRNESGAQLVKANSTTYSLPSTLTEGIYYYFAKVSAPNLATKTTEIATVIVESTSSFTVKVMKDNLPQDDVRV